MIGRLKLTESFLKRQSSAMSFKKWFHRRLKPKLEIERQTVDDVKNKLIQLLGVHRHYNETTSRAKPLPDTPIPTEQSLFSPRTMYDSYDEAFVPLEKDIGLRETYLTFLSGIRVSRILEDLDLFSVWLCYRHIVIPNYDPKDPHPYFVVTARVDNIDFSVSRPQIDKDIRLSGHVTWVGKSSMEVVVYIDQMTEGKWAPFTMAFFVMVARNPKDNKPAIVNPLRCDSAIEKTLFEEGDRNQELRKMKQKTSLLSEPPSEKEKAALHHVYLETLDPGSMTFFKQVIPKGAIWMQDTILKSTFVCNPIIRNLYNKVFGGLAMKRAHELAWTAAYIHSGSRPFTRHIDTIIFLRPVELGSLLTLQCQVSYVEGTFMQLRVMAESSQPDKGTKHVTNMFNFTFQASSEIAPVIPRTYTESMIYLDGRRHFLNFKGELSIEELESQGTPLF